MGQTSDFNNNPFSVCFTSMKLRYQYYDQTIDQLNFVCPDDKINVFISFESVLNNLGMIKDIENKLLLERDFPKMLASDTINLCAHYRRFFRKNNLETRVFIYYTDLSSDIFNEYTYNDEYRSYYINKYTQNPKFQLLGTKLVETIIPMIQEVLVFCPNVYFIKAHNIEGSLVPLIIHRADSNYRNFIITCDKFETQYLLKNKEFCTHMIRKSKLGTTVHNTFMDYLKIYMKDLMTENLDSELNILQNPSFYTTLLSSVGDKMRSIDPLKGVGCKTILKLLISGVNRGFITGSTESSQLISQIFPMEYRESFLTNFQCINLDQAYSHLSQLDIYNIIKQIEDRSDLSSLEKLNAKGGLFESYPLMLPELTQ